MVAQKRTILCLCGLVRRLIPANISQPTARQRPRQHVTAVGLPPLTVFVQTCQVNGCFGIVGTSSGLPVSTGAVKVLVRNWSADFITLSSCDAPCSCRRCVTRLAQRLAQRHGDEGDFASWSCQLGRISQRLSRTSIFLPSGKCY